jgi:hypothetical protein
MSVESKSYGVGRGAGVGRDRGTGVGLAVGEGVAVGVGLGSPLKWHSVTVMLSMRQPSPEPLLSLAILQRSLPSTTSVGRFTVVVIKPPELPLHAWRYKCDTKILSYHCQCDLALLPTYPLIYFVMIHMSSCVFLR